MFSKKKHFIHFSVEEIDKSMKLYGRNEESLQEDVNSMRTWIKTQPHLPNYELADMEIGNFLLSSKFRIEKAKLLIDNYFTSRHLLPEIFESCHPLLPEQVEFRKNCIVVMSLNLTESCRRIFFIKPLKSGTFTPQILFKNFVHMGELRLRNDLRVGEIIVIDMENISLSDALQFNLKWIKMGLWIYQNVYSIRIDAVYVINATAVVDYMLTLLKTVLKPKIFNRIHCDQRYTILFKNFKKNEIPKDYGGDAPSLAELQAQMEKGYFLEFFDQLNDLRTKESLRPQPLNNDELLGFYGNFKKLNVD